MGLSLKKKRKSQGREKGKQKRSQKSETTKKEERRILSLTRLKAFFAISSVSVDFDKTRFPIKNSLKS